jgi:hypothetical protein
MGAPLDPLPPPGGGLRIAAPWFLMDFSSPYAHVHNAIRIIGHEKRYDAVRGPSPFDLRTVQ